jgi:hypothetical protein
MAPKSVSTKNERSVRLVSVPVIHTLVNHQSTRAMFVFTVLATLAGLSSVGEGLTSKIRIGTTDWVCGCCSDVTVDSCRLHPSIRAIQR